jgi:cell division protein FtsW (lipid II flippase)
MRTLFTDRHRDLFLVLFWIFEVLFVASMVVIFRTDSPFHPETINAAAQIVWLASFVCLFIVSFILRRSARYLANIGWLTLTGAILFAMAFPRL